PVPVAFDPDRIEQVLANLIGNALKFTPAGGHVRVNVAREAVPGDTEAVLRVSDTGPGIPPEALPHLFDRFFQLDDGPTRVHGGLGLGLALVKELVELHGGRVEAGNLPGQGAAFTVHLPIAADVMLPLPESPVEMEETAARGPDVPALGADLVGDTQRAPDTTVLVAEDHPDLRAFLEEHLTPFHRVVTVADGRAAWEELQRNAPDLVVTDVMMPEMDGLELLGRLKGDPRYRAIPVLLLTARADPEDRLGGLEAEADGYLAKPFSVAELKALVRNLIGLRRAVEQRSGQQVVAVAPEDMPLEDTNAAFVRRVQAAIAARLSDPDFDVPALASALFMSERTLQRRIAELTGFAAGTYVRHVRLLHAKELIERNAYQTLSEVARAVGFQNVSHFSRRYTETFGVAPSSRIQER
ncbi:MAG TPA: ATP-binding protein, partial [Rhodothermales bacterium]|nr:ATP-binding protein [Rhodothermales bacterium]